MPFLQAVRFINTNSSTAAKQERANVYQYRYVARAAKNERETIVTMMMMMMMMRDDECPRDDDDDECACAHFK